MYKAPDKKDDNTKNKIEITTSKPIKLVIATMSPRPFIAQVIKKGTRNAIAPAMKSPRYFFPQLATTTSQYRKI